MLGSASLESASIDTVVMDTQRELHDDNDHLFNLHHEQKLTDSVNDNSGNDDSNSRKLGSTNSHLQEFTLSLDGTGDDSDIQYDNNSFTGKFTKLKFNGETVILENKNIFQNHKLKFQLIGSMITLFLIGLADQTIGSLIEYVLDQYKIDRVQISYLFIAQFCGYIPSSLFNNYLMKNYGLFYLYCSSCILVCFSSTMYIMTAPFPVLIFCSILLGWANGTFDCCLNYFVGTLDYSNELLGLMHSMYGAGCLVTPVLSIHLVKKGMKWNYYYIFLLLTAFINFLFGFFLFQNETSAKYRYVSSQENQNDAIDTEIDIDENNDNDEEIFENDNKFNSFSEPTMFETITNKYVAFFSIALFVYVGSELSVGIWLNNYMFRIQNITAENASLITSCFWLFMTLGRGFMGFYTGKYFDNIEIRAIVFYCFMVALGCLLFWIFKFSIIMQIVSICMAGWFVGPLFGTTIIIAIKSLPKKFALHGISLIAGFGGAGAAIIPAIMGYISEHFGNNDINDDNNGAGLIFFPQVIFTTFAIAASLWASFYFFNKNSYDNKIRLK